ncbi:MIT domain-containing protein 1-like isoform X1 [Anastrepha ludens]|uniref:MIT domain-containing protein 1-like isoform X1 n=1 Tax=Anastrepha ludens TaxID=28586 RepID=UPI0023B09424|nr:MIT domain-containing protein 1-like isoform X1 [Anastrepha ludens]
MLEIKSIRDKLMRAVECDQAGLILEAQDLYDDGRQMLFQIMAHETDEAKKKSLNERNREYIDRAEQIKEHVQKLGVGGQLVAHIPIDENSVGNSYRSLFGKYLDAEVKEVLLEEPHLYRRHHFQNLISFLELLVKNCPCFRYIRLVTKTSSESPDDQRNALEQIKTDLSKRNVTLRIKVLNTQHDRKVVLSSGYIIMIGLGLHIFKPLNPFYSLGLCDNDFRNCRQTEVNIFRKKNLVS